MHQLGIKVHLHCFEYGRNHAEELKEICEQVYYYKRAAGFLQTLSFKPFIVASRKSEKLMHNLLKDDYPVLFEGLHSCYYLNDSRLKNRFTIFRESNIEDQYYYHLFKAEKNLLKKFYFLVESFKLKLFEKTVRKASLILPVSQSDFNHFKKKYSGNNVVYLPSFHPNEDILPEQGRGNYVLYHGNLSVTENTLAASYLINEIFNGINIPLIIAGLNPPNELLHLAKKNPDVKIIASPSDKEMLSLIKNAQVNLLVTFQATGLKLKLLNVLFNGRFCLVNDKMLKGTGLDDLCTVANNTKEIKEELESLYGKDFDLDQKEKRHHLLKENYYNKTNAEKLVRLIF